MSHPVNDEIKEELGRGLEEVIAAYHRIRQYILQYEVYELLDKSDVEFLNNLSKAIKEYNPNGQSDS